VVAGTEANVAAPAVLPGTCCDSTGGGLAPGAAALPTAGAKVVATGIEGKVPMLETALPDVGA